MNEKPGFWDFHRANRLSRYNEDLLYVYERKRGKLVLYKKLPSRYKWQFVGAGIAMIVGAAVFVPWIIYRDSVLFLSSAIPELMLIMFIITQFIGNFVVGKLIYARMDFEKISEVDWDDAKESEFRKSNYWRLKFPLILPAGIYLIMVLLIGLTPVYIRYVADRALGTPWQAEVIISTPQDCKISLDSETQSGEVFTLEGLERNESVYINIRTLRIPEQVELYVNGEAVNYGKDAVISGYAGLFWVNDYFSIHIRDDLLFNIHEGENTLELKSGNFSKSWTFNIEYE